LEAEKVKELGGLFVLGTQRNESRRIDDQLRGRAARQGDPGETRFYLSLEDDLLRIFGGSRIQSLMTTLNLPDESPIESAIVAKVVDEAQKKVEGINFDIRKHLLDYDTVLNKQRSTVYKRRQNFLERIEKGETNLILKDIVSNVLQRNIKDVEFELFENWLEEINLVKNLSDKEYQQIQSGLLPQRIIERINQVSKDPQVAVEILASIDIFWTNHLENLEALSESVRMRALWTKRPADRIQKRKPPTI
jgi:Preprotein translocase subunit SecA (ATPase, RNA helicase)